MPGIGPLRHSHYRHADSICDGCFQDTRAALWFKAVDQVSACHGSWPWEHAIPGVQSKAFTWPELLGVDKQWVGAPCLACMSVSQLNHWSSHTDNVQAFQYQIVHQQWLLNCHSTALIRAFGKCIAICSNDIAANRFSIGNVIVFARVTDDGASRFHLQKQALRF